MLTVERIDGCGRADTTSPGAIAGAVVGVLLVCFCCCVIVLAVVLIYPFWRSGYMERVEGTDLSLRQKILVAYFPCLVQRSRSRLTLGSDGDNRESLLASSMLASSPLAASFTTERTFEMRSMGGEEVAVGPLSSLSSSVRPSFDDERSSTRLLPVPTAREKVMSGYEGDEPEMFHSPLGFSVPRVENPWRKK